MSKKLKTYISQMRSIISCIDKEQHLLSKQLSALDKKVSALYHEIEVTNFNAAKGFSLARDLQDILRERRAVKNQIAIWNHFSQAIDGNEISRALNNVSKKIDSIEKKQQEFLATYQTTNRKTG